MKICMGFCLRLYCNSLHIFLNKCVFLKRCKEINTHFTSILILLRLTAIEIIAEM
jgi:hypothetical protein